jgi:hypothetical protein
MILYVRYKNGRTDYVNAILIDSLIQDNKISMFYRPSEKQWVDVDTGRIRRREGSCYSGEDRRCTSPLCN